MKIGIVGLGYWGKIILNNLLDLGHKDVVLCDTKEVLSGLNLQKRFKYETSYERLRCDKVFVLTPVETHYEICNYFLNQGVDVFCEKVLTADIESASALYDLADKRGCNLFVDWIFTFNNEVNILKRMYQDGILGKIKHACMSRQNFGPVRYDVDARYDLSSHDVSILFHIFEQPLKSMSWKNYKRDKESTKEDSALGILHFQDYSAILNASWKHPVKDRRCFFECEKVCVEWDDATQDLSLSWIESPPSNLEEYYTTGASPLHNSISAFLDPGRNFNYTRQKILTLDTIGALNSW